MAVDWAYLSAAFDFPTTTLNGKFTGWDKSDVDDQAQIAAIEQALVNLYNGSELDYGDMISIATM